MKRGLIYAGIVFMLDQLSKFYIDFFLMEGKKVLEVTGFFNIVNVRNRGVSFSFLANDNEIIQYFIIATVIGIIVWMLFWLHKEKDALIVVALSFIIGGALGNLADRFTYGAVVDFLDFHLFGWHWPAFNVADMFICIGAFILILRTILTPVKEMKINEK